MKVLAFLTEPDVVDRTGIQADSERVPSSGRKRNFLSFGPSDNRVSRLRLSFCPRTPKTTLPNV